MDQSQSKVALAQKLIGFGSSNNDVPDAGLRCSHEADDVGDQ